jgi:hypothetical protein
MMNDEQKFKLAMFSIAVLAFMFIAFLLTIKEFKTVEIGMKNGYQQDKGGNWVKVNTLNVHE